MELAVTSGFRGRSTYTKNIVRCPSTKKKSFFGYAIANKKLKTNEDKEKGKQNLDCFVQFHYQHYDMS